MKYLLAQVYKLSNDYNSALSLHQEAFKSAERAGNLSHQIMNLICMMSIYKELGDRVALQDTQNKLALKLKSTEISLDQWASMTIDDFSSFKSQLNG